MAIEFPHNLDLVYILYFRRKEDEADGHKTRLTYPVA